MDLLLDKDCVRNTTITLLNGQPIYQISTPSRFLEAETTTIKKIRGHEVYDMATVEIHTFHDDVCRVWGRDMVPKVDGFWKTSKSFIASDGQRYKWKTKPNEGPKLYDKYDNTVGAFEKSHSGFFSGSPRQAKLTISQAGLSVVDDIVATFVLVEQTERIAKAIGRAGDAVDAAAG